MLDEAPYKLPLAPSVGPNAKAKTIGLIGSFNSSLAANESITLTIIAVTGVESTTDDDNADNYAKATKNVHGHFEFSNWKAFYF